MSKEDYVFEKEDKRFFDIREDLTKNDELEFARRLGFDIKDPSLCSLNSCRIINGFVRAVHHNILWYVRSRKRQVIWYRWYMVLTVVLVILVPLAPLFISSSVLDTALESNSGADGGLSEFPTSIFVSAQLTALIAGIYGVHRLFSSWLFRRNSAYAFWKASAELKEILYTIEERWEENTALGGVLDPNFLRDLKQGETAARGILRVERDSFFSAYEKTSVNLQEVVTKSTSGAGTVVGMIADPIFKKVAENVKLKADQRGAINTARGRVVNLLSQRRQLAERIARGKAKSLLITDPARKQPQAEQVKADQRELANVGTQLVQAKAAYEEKWNLYAQ